MWDANTHLCACEGEGGGNEDRAEALEAVGEGAGVAPIAAAYVASWCGALACYKHDAQDVERNDCNDLDDRKHKFHLTIPFDAEDVYNHNDLGTASASRPCTRFTTPTHRQKNNHKRIPINRIIPELNRNRRRHNLQRQRHQPLQRIIIPHRHPPRRIYEPRRECRETACYREQHRHLPQRLHRAVEHDSDDSKCNDQGCRTACCECAATADEEPGADAASYCYHLKVSPF